MRSPLVVLLMLTTGCAHVATLRPAAKGSVELELALGGPLFKQGGSTVPGTLTSIGARYGLQERADVHVHLHPTAALLGILGVDAGSSVWLVQGARFKPDLTATVRVLAFSDFHSPLRPYLQLAAVASWRIGRFAPYLGVDVTGPGPHLGLAAGVQATFGRFTLQLEGKGFGIAYGDLQPFLREWVNSADLAPVSVQLGVGYRLR